MPSSPGRAASPPNSSARVRIASRTVVLHARQRDGQWPGELGNELPPGLERCRPHRGGDADDLDVPQAARAQRVGQHRRLAERERPRDARRRERHAELLADRVEDQAEPRVRGARIPRHRDVATVLAQHAARLPNRRGGLVHEHQPVPADDGVEALVGGVEPDLVAHERRDLREAGGAASGRLHHRRRCVTEHDAPGVADPGRCGDPGPAGAGGDVQHRVPGADPGGVQHRRRRRRELHVDALGVALPGVGDAVPHLRHAASIPQAASRPAKRRSASGAAPQELDELGALALGEPADGLARRDPALLQDLVGLDAAELRRGQQHVEDLGGLEVLRR